MKALNVITFALLAIGGINWGLVGMFDLNLVSAIFGTDTGIANLVYILVGLSALWQAFTYRWDDSLSYAPGRHQHA
jgi:hypothetical protein